MKVHRFTAADLTDAQLLDLDLERCPYTGAISRIIRPTGPGRAIGSIHNLPLFAWAWTGDAGTASGARG